MGMPMALVGTPFIIIAAYAVRSLPASVRSGVAALQQIDPSIEEASNILGGDAQYTFRKVTLPLILPALLAGLIFSFTRHMTSLIGHHLFGQCSLANRHRLDSERVGTGRYQHCGSLFYRDHPVCVDCRGPALFHDRQAAARSGRRGFDLGRLRP